MGLFGKRFLVILFKFCGNTCGWKSWWKYVLWCLNNSFHYLNTVTRRGLTSDFVLTIFKQRNIALHLLIIIHGNMVRRLWVVHSRLKYKIHSLNLTKISFQFSNIAFVQSSPLSFKIVQSRPSIKPLLHAPLKCT